MLDMIKVFIDIE